jgi:UDP-N-acetyl-2-amino-2-deoxyglucuronate dehydrogenase
MSKGVGFAVIGTGNIGKHHIDCIKEAKGAELVAICGRRPEVVGPLAEANGVAGYTDFQEMLQRDDIDVVNICTPSGVHSDMIQKCAEAGKHVITEKPLDITLDRIDKAIYACREAGVKLACIFQNRFIGTNQAIKEFIDQGGLGRLLIGTASILWYRPQEYYDKGGWRGTWALDGGGALMNQSIHTIDLLQWFMGPVESVMGHAGALNHNIETEDTGLAILKFKNGAVGTILGTTCAYPGLATMIQLMGQKGSIVSDNNKLKAWKIQKDTKEEEMAEEAKMLKAYGALDAESGLADPTAITKEGHIFQIEDMVRAIEEGRDPVLTGEDARHSVEIILSIYESSKTGEEITLD